MVDMMLARLIAFSLPCMCVYNEYIIDRRAVKLGLSGKLFKEWRKERRSDESWRLWAFMTRLYLKYLKTE